MDIQKYSQYLKWRTKILLKSDPQTLGEFCEALEITPEEIKEFHKVATFDDDLILESLRWAKARVPEILHTVFKEITISKSVADAERFINMIKRMEDRTGSSPTGNQFNFFVTDDKYKRILSREIGAIAGKSNDSAEGSDE